MTSPPGSLGGLPAWQYHAFEPAEIGPADASIGFRDPQPDSQQKSDQCQRGGKRPIHNFGTQRRGPLLWKSAQAGEGFEHTRVHGAVEGLQILQAVRAAPAAFQTHVRRAMARILAQPLSPLRECRGRILGIQPDQPGGGLCLRFRGVRSPVQGERPDDFALVLGDGPPRNFRYGAALRTHPQTAPRPDPV
jgi:hypothetical protein